MFINKTKQYLVSSIGIVTIFFFTTAFIIKSNEKIFSNPDVIVSVVPGYGSLTVSVKTSKNINVHFYMFSVEGRLVKELNITGSQKISIIQLEKGIYIYDFFSNDERLKNGKIELR